MSAISETPRVINPTGFRPFAPLAVLANTSIGGRLAVGYILVMPLIAGIPRGKLVPLLRMSEVAQLGVTSAGLYFALQAYRQGKRWKFQFMPVDFAMIALAFFSFVTPVLWLIARQEPFGLRLIMSASPLVKYLMLYLVVRIGVRELRDLTAINLAVGISGCVIAAVSILEALGIGPVVAVLAKFWTTGGGGSAAGRSYTTLGSALSTGALLSMASGITIGKAVVERSLFWLGVSGFILVGIMASGQMTSVLGLGLVVLVAAICHRVMTKAVIIGVPAAIVGAALMWPIIAARLADSGSGSIVPQSWLIRWANVSKLYWPSVRDGGWLLGVSPETVIVPPDTWRSEVFLESGYLWALWVGGVPLLIALVAFLVLAVKALAVRLAHPTANITRIGALGAVVFVIVLSLIDPHASLRGGADMLYVLTAASLAGRPFAISDDRQNELIALLHKADRTEPSSSARLQIAEIGSEMLRQEGWADVPPIDGIDRGIDVAVRDRGRTVASARLFFERRGHRLEGVMMQPMLSIDETSQALCWRAVLMCAKSLRMNTLTLPSTHGKIGHLTRREIGFLGEQAMRLERKRVPAAAPESEIEQLFRAQENTPPGVRLNPHVGISKKRRSVDVILVSGAILVSLPFAPLGAYMVWRVRKSSSADAIFRQMRLGGGGLPFELMKFRTMNNSAGDNVHRKAIEAALEDGVLDVKDDTDSRVTPIGAFLRKTSLDELPQLWNVMRGEMTLVGPRPSLLWESSLYPPRLRRRLSVVPGIAGLWQASGRGDLGVEEMLELDLEYVDSASASNDIKLMASTAVSVVRGKGAR